MEIQKLNEELNDCHDEIQDLQKLEDMSHLNEEQAKEKDQLNEILKLILDGLSNPKLSQIVADLKYLNSELRRAKQNMGDSYIGQDDLNILERKISLMRDETSLLLSKMRLQTKPNATQNTYSDSYDQYDDRIHPVPVAEAKPRQSQSNFRHQNLDPYYFNDHGGQDLEIQNTGSNLNALTVSIRSNFNAGNNPALRTEYEPSQTLPQYGNATAKSGTVRSDTMSGYAHLRDKLSMMQTGQY